MLEKILQLVFPSFLPYSQFPFSVLKGKHHLASGLTFQCRQWNSVINQSTSFLNKFNCQKFLLHNNPKLIFYIFYLLALINPLSL